MSTSWEVDQITMPLQAGIATYALPVNTVNLLDSYLRQYPGGATTLLLGNALVPMTTVAGDPMLTALGEPMILSPSSGVFSTVQGSPIITMRWLNHGLSPSSPIFLSTPVTIGASTFYGPFIAVSSVVDQNNIQFLAPAPASRR